MAVGVANAVASKFYNSSPEFQSLNGFDEEDLRSLLYERVVFRKYLPFVEGVYSSEKAFKNSCWTACLNACRNHYEKMFLTKKRDFIEAPDNAVVAVEDRKSLHATIRDCCDMCECPITQRIILLIGYGRYTTKSELKKALPLTPRQFEKIWLEVKRIFVENIDSFSLPTLAFCHE